MVSPNEDWEESENGYQSESEFISVKPSVVEIAGGMQNLRTGGIPESEANAYTVDLESQTDSWDVVANFEDPREAWELANILTHYFNDRRQIWTSKRDLLHEDPHFPGEEQEVPDIVSELSGKEVFERLIHPRPIPEDMEQLYEDWR